MPGRADGDERGACAPAWLTLLAGWLTASAVLASLEPRGERALRSGWSTHELVLPPAAEEWRVGERGIDLARSSPRSLRQLPGIGRKRALELVRARRSLAPGEAFELSSVRGIGPLTEQLVREWLERASER